MQLLAWYLEEETPRLKADGVRLSVIGRRDRLPATVLAAIVRAEEEFSSMAGAGTSKPTCAA
jgi:undecaprenyl diphosphate synthase